MKKLISFIFVINMAIMVFGQEKTTPDEKQLQEEIKYPKNILAINLGYLFEAFRNGNIGFGLGVWYERSLNNYFSAIIYGGGIGFKTEDTIEYLQFDVSLHGRFYPQGNALAKFFLGIGVGYSFVSIEYKNNAEASNIFKITPEAGYKFCMSMIVFEISLGYKFSFGEIKYPKNVIGELNDSILNAIEFEILWGIKLKN